MTFNTSSSVRLAAIAFTCLGLLAGAAARAAEATPGQHPERGAHMATVEQQFGAPATRYPAVGQPAITRWDYPGMVVYFENDLVLHTVLVGSAS